MNKTIELLKDERTEIFYKSYTRRNIRYESDDEYNRIEI